MKCPCEKCLLLTMCNNRHTSNRPHNFILSINKCSLLWKYLIITKTNAPTMELWSDLEDKELQQKLQEVGKYIPYE